MAFTESKDPIGHIAVRQPTHRLVDWNLGQPLSTAMPLADNCYDTVHEYLVGAMFVCNMNVCNLQHFWECL